MSSVVTGFAVVSFLDVYSCALFLVPILRSMQIGLIVEPILLFLTAALGFLQSSCDNWMSPGPGQQAQLLACRIYYTPLIKFLAQMTFVTMVLVTFLYLNPAIKTPIQFKGEKNVPEVTADGKVRRSKGFVSQTVRTLSELINHQAHYSSAYIIALVAGVGIWTLIQFSLGLLDNGFVASTYVGFAFLVAYIAVINIPLAILYLWNTHKIRSPLDYFTALLAHYNKQVLVVITLLVIAGVVTFGVLYIVNAIATIALLRPLRNFFVASVITLVFYGLRSPTAIAAAEKKNRKKALRDNNSN